MSTPVRASDRDLHALAAIVSQDRPDLPDGEGLPLSLLADLCDQIRCDKITLGRVNSARQADWLLQCIPALSDDELEASNAFDASNALEFEERPPEWQHYWDCHWDCQTCSYPDRTGDFRSVVTIGDFYSARQWHGTGMYCDYYRPGGLEHELQLCLPDPVGLSAAPGQHLRLYLFRGPGPDFSERDRALLTLLRPHLHHAYLDAERRRHPVPQLTPRQTDLLRLLAAGHTNAQIARRLGLSEGTVRTHLENIYGRLQVNSRTAAVARAFPDLVASLCTTGHSVAHTSRCRCPRSPAWFLVSAGSLDCGSAGWPCRDRWDTVRAVCGVRCGR